MVRARLKKWGGSLGIVISSAEVRKRGLREGMEIEFEPRPAGIDLRALRRVVQKIPKAQMKAILAAIDRDEGWHE